MTFLIPTPEQARAGVRAIKTTLTAAGPLAPSQRAALDAVQRVLLRTAFDLDALEPIEPAELAACITDPALRTQFVNGLVTLTMLDERVDARHADAVDRFATALDVKPAAVGQLRKLAEQRTFLLRLDVLRHGPTRDGIRAVYESEGAVGVLRNLAGFAGLIENADIAAKYHALADYPAGTLGRELHRFYVARGFKFPGEKGGAPEGLLPHDLSHVIGGYDTDLRSEALVLSFTAGYRRENMYGVLIFLILQAQHGLKLTPLAETAHGFLSDPALVGQMVEAFARGAKMTVDLMDRWDFWAVMDQPLAAVRARYNVAPAPAAGD